MKIITYIKFIVIFILSAFTVVACLKTDNNTQPLALTEHDKSLISTFSQAGIIHNKGMDYIYEKLVSDAQKSNFKNVEIGLKDINKYAFQFLRESYSALINPAEEVKYYHADLQQQNQDYDSYQITSHIERVNKTQVSQSLKDAFAQFELIFKNTSIQHDYTKYDLLVEKLVPTLSNDLDKMTFISTVSVGKYTLQYWSENSSKWQSFATLIAPKGKNNIATLRRNGSGIAYADVAGAATGAVRGAMVGLAGGTMTIPGLGTAVGGAGGVMVGMIGGAIGGSAAEAMHDFIKWAIDW